MEGKDRNKESQPSIASKLPNTLRFSIITLELQSFQNMNPCSTIDPKLENFLETRISSLQGIKSNQILKFPETSSQIVRVKKYNENL